MSGLSGTLIGRLTDLLQPARWRFVGPVPRSTNDYATHIPVLIGVAKSRPIRCVLELGSGRYSTRAFLNRQAFPDLERLESFETNGTWANTIKEFFEIDNRATLHVVSSIAPALDKLDLDQYDLIFVDDSASAEERIRTIGTLQKKRPPWALVVIHDFEYTDYVRAARSFRYRFVFKALNPETAVVWETRPAIRQTLKRIDAVIKHHAGGLRPDDVEGWVDAFCRVAR